jgi:TRAP-type C4-dicarboxylate transport system permease small subunit
MSQVIGAVSSSLIWFVLFAIILQVIFRYVLRKPLIWTEEISRYMMIWLVYSGALLLARKGEHVRIDFFVNFMPVWLQTVLSLVVNLVISFSLIALLFGSWGPLQDFTYLKSPAMQMPLIYVFIIVPISSFFMLFHYLKSSVQDLKTLCSYCRRGEVK